MTGRTVISGFCPLRVQPRQISILSSTSGVRNALFNPHYAGALLSRFGPCGLFLVPEVKILTKMSPISDGRGDRRKFDKGPSRHPTKHVPGRVPELEKPLGAVYQEWRGVH